MSFVAELIGTVTNIHVLLDMTSIRHTLKKGWSTKLGPSEILSVQQPPTLQPASSQREVKQTTAAFNIEE